MNEDYLWDKSGEPDPEIQRLETLLSPLGHKPIRQSPAWPAIKRSRAPLYSAIAASLLVLSWRPVDEWQRTGSRPGRWLRWKDRHLEASGKRTNPSPPTPIPGPA